MARRKFERELTKAVDLTQVACDPRILRKECFKTDGDTIVFYSIKNHKPHKSKLTVVNPGVNIYQYTIKGKTFTIEWFL